MTWRLIAACRNMDPAIFFPRPGASADYAKTVCAGCSVRAECAEAGREERHGIWSGKTRGRQSQKRRAA